VYLALAIGTLLFVFYTQSFFSDIVNPLRSVIAQMGKVSDGDFSVRATVEGPAEFRALGSAFNVMVGRIDSLTRQIVAEQKERTKTEIEALRFQLNPHFICNTLNAIGMMASIAKVDSIKRMTGALTRIMRETLQADDTVFALEDELKNLESYVYIMKIRFGDSFEYQVGGSGARPRGHPDHAPPAPRGERHPPRPPRPPFGHHRGVGPSRRRVRAP
jgi:two-component system sensor histidine kinase YesM